jgi:RNA polymerase sigma factor (TIGR02999 family)
VPDSPPPTDHGAAALLDSWAAGDQRALDALIPLVYAELRRLARAYLKQERPEHTLQTTALVHEAYVRLTGQREVDWRNRQQLIGLAAQMMRRILVNHAVARNATKRGGGRERASMTAALTIAAEASDQGVELAALDSALKQLEVLDPRQARIVELRYFGGLTIEETAAALRISVATVKREWQLAKVWLYRAVAGRSAD